MEDKQSETAKMKYEDSIGNKIHSLVDLVIERDGGVLKPVHLNLLCGMTTQSLLDSGLISKGEVKETYDTGETQIVSDLMAKANEAGDYLMSALKVDEQGDWGANFEDEEKLRDMLHEASTTFKRDLIQLLSKE